MPLYVGCSGWQYRDWRGAFYPPKLPQRLWLEHYANGFATVEVNATFYRLPKAEAVDTWARTAPDDFVFALKVSRYLTLVLRLREPVEPVGRFLGLARRLGRKLGPLLVQLPPNLKADPDALDATLDTLGRTVRVAVEPRHETWFTKETYEVLEREGSWNACRDKGLLRLEGKDYPIAEADVVYFRFNV